MSHLDPELVALLALGEDVATAAERQHLRDCTLCRSERERLIRAVEAGRIPGAAQPSEHPDPRVWTGIATELGLSPRLRQDPLTTDPGGVAAPGRTGRPRRRWRAVALAVAAAVVVVTGTGVAVVLTRPRTHTIARAQLHAFPGWTGQRGTAVLERRGDGPRVVEVRTTTHADATGDREVWLMTAGARRLVSLGLLHGTSGSFEVPSGIDLDRYRLVDVSDEPRDGNPAHSGDSVVRGVLTQSPRADRRAGPRAQTSHVTRRGWRGAAGQLLDHAAPGPTRLSPARPAPTTAPTDRR